MNEPNSPAVRGPLDAKVERLPPNKSGTKNVHVAFDEWMRTRRDKFRLSLFTTQEQFDALLKEAFLQGTNVGHANGLAAYPLWDARPLDRA